MKKKGSKRGYKHRWYMDKWVSCVSCGEQFFIESYETSPACPVCGSQEFEEEKWTILDPEDDPYEPL